MKAPDVILVCPVCRENFNRRPYAVKQHQERHDEGFPMCCSYSCARKYNWKERCKNSE